MHNDGELAVANTLAAVGQGVRHVQGTLNGYGERCGNANLASLIPNLRYKLRFTSIPEKQLSKLTEVSRFVASVANLPLNDHQPFTGASAFAHKAGVHIDAILKAPGSYEHMDPSLVGNERRLLASEQAGKATVLAKAKAWGVKVKDAEGAKEIIRLIKQRELEGYQYEGADASLELLMRRHLGSQKQAFSLLSYHVDVERRQALEPSEASVKLQVGKAIEFTVAEGNGPVNALDAALRQALAPHYPALKGVELIDYKVRVLNNSGQHGGTGARVRVLIESRDPKGRTWSTVGVHANIIEASWEALVDAVEWRLIKHGKR
jgi:2-isopropylmalate synthase